MKILQESTGALWVLSSHGSGRLISFRGGRWREYGQSEGLPDGCAISIAASHDGTLWAQGADGIYALPSAGVRFAKVLSRTRTNSAFAEDRRGRMWLASGNAVLRLPQLTPSSVSPVEPIVRLPRANEYPAIAFDADDALWMTNPVGGVTRFRRADLSQTGATDAVKGEPFGVDQGLTANQATQVLEDRERNVWVATATGLDRFRVAKLVPDLGLPVNPRDGVGLLSDASGAVYGADNDTLYLMHKSRAADILAKGLDHPGGFCRDRVGGLWVGSDGSLIHLNAGKITGRYRWEAEFNFYGCAVDASGRIWGAGGKRGLFRFDGSKWSAMSLPGISTSLNPPTQIEADGQGRVLVYYRGLGVARFEGLRVTLWRSLQKRLGAITDIYNGRDGVLIAGDEGLAKLVGSGFQFLSSDRHPSLTGIRGMLDTTAGDTWFMTDTEVLRFRTSALAQAFKAPDAPFPMTSLDQADGVPKGVFSYYGLTEGPDGRVAVATDEGLAWFDPLRGFANPVAPMALVNSVVSGDRRYDQRAGAKLLPGTRDITVAYTAPSLTIPERVRFRYRLDGADKDWVDAGTRRQAFYTNLGPGNYIFHVVAANEAGVWGAESSSYLIKIPPTFVESWIFKLLILGLLAGLVWLVFQIRLRQQAQRYRARLEAQVVERERIARELHDTLLQGFQGLILRFQALAEGMPTGANLRADVDRALDVADGVLLEGRRRVRDLRAVGHGIELVDAIAECAARHTAVGERPLGINEKGAPRPLNPYVQEEAERIVEEAVRNARAHSGAGAIECTVTYEAREFRIEVRDDGRGLPAHIASSGRRQGHFGLVGMRERAAHIDARLWVESHKGVGVTVTLVVPAAIAYAPGERSRSIFRFLSPARGIHGRLD